MGGQLIAHTGFGRIKSGGGASRVESQYKNF